MRRLNIDRAETICILSVKTNQVLSHIVELVTRIQWDLFYVFNSASHYPIFVNTNSKYKEDHPW